MLLSRRCLLIHERELRSRREQRFIKAEVSATTGTGGHLVLDDKTQPTNDAHTQLRFKESTTDEVRSIITWVGSSLGWGVGKIGV
jgi:hypothetical protein